MIFCGFLFLPFFYHLPVNSIIFTNLPVNLKAGKSSTLRRTTAEQEVFPLTAPVAKLRRFEVAADFFQVNVLQLAFLRRHRSLQGI